MHIWNDGELEYILKNTGSIFVSIYGLNAQEYNMLTRTDNYYKMLQNTKKMLEILGDEYHKVMIEFRTLKKYTSGELENWMIENLGRRFPYEYITEYSNGGILDITKPLPEDATWLPIGENNSTCFGTSKACQIYVNGDVSICNCAASDYEEELGLGNILNSDFKALLNSEKLDSIMNFGNKSVGFVKSALFIKI